MTGTSIDPGGRFRADGIPSLAGIGAAALVAVAFAVATGPIGLVAGVLTGAVWYVLGVPYAVATGVVALIGVTPAGTDFTAITLVTGAMTALVVTPVGRRHTARLAVGTIAAAGGLLVAAWWLATAVSHSTAAIGLLGTIGLGIYAIHRYERVALGLEAAGPSVTTRDRETALPADRVAHDAAGSDSFGTDSSTADRHRPGDGRGPANGRRDDHDHTSDSPR